MANLKDLKNRIKSVKSTQKITAAMKMVAAAKLRRAQENALAARPYAAKMMAMVQRLAARGGSTMTPILLSGGNEKKRHLLVVVSADRGLCGGFNTNIIRATRYEVRRLIEKGVEVDLLMVGRKATDALRRDFSDRMISSLEGIQGTSVAFADSEKISTMVVERIENGEADSCSILYNRFISAIAQEVTEASLVPVALPDNENDAGKNEGKIAVAPYEYEPDEASVLAEVLPRNLATQIHTAILESAAAELAARMTAMDNATRNAGDLIDNLVMRYNRTRQAAITTELIEIISGAEAL